MKKLSILITGLFIASAVFTSCTKDDAEATPSNPIGKATIKGVVEMNSDQTENKVTKPGDPANETVWEYPAGVQLTATIDADDLVQDPSNTVNYPKKAYYTTIGDDGSYAFSIDAGRENVTVTITGADLRKDLITYETLKQKNSAWLDSLDASGNYIWITKVDHKKVWSMNPKTVTVIEKDIKINDYKYE